MKKKILLVVIVLFALANGYSQAQVWKKVSAESLSGLEKLDRTSSPSEFELYSLDFEGLKSMLKTAPSREAQTGMSNVIVSFPTPEGKMQKFRIYEASVLESEIAARHQEIKSYVGQGIDDKTAMIRFSTTIYGLHTMSSSANGTAYIDPFTTDIKNYIVYKKSSLNATRQFTCDTDDSAFNFGQSKIENVTFATDGTLRKYRLAMACTIEYAAFHVNRAGVSTGTEAQKKAAVLAAMAVSVTRLNQIYEKDMAVTMVLVNGNESIIYVGDEDPFTNSPAMINEIQPIVDAAIGAANYDMGHGVCTTDSGIAQLQSVCGPNKARGITGQPNPVGDTFDIDYVAHEMGHQFGATHTQNNDCNRSVGTAVEPGSASTIMGYAGICAPNVQGNSDDYFHAVSLAQMFSFVTTGGGTCSVNIPNGNAVPVIAPFSSYTIPAGTPFVLRGSATDVDGDTLTYCWEQTNSGTTSAVPSATSTASNPNFRSVAPTVSPNRYFPALPTVVSGSLASTWEVIPTVTRNLSFALTVRDNKSPNGGQTARRNCTIAVNATNAPFTVTSQNTDRISWTQGQSQTITWNVAGTNVAPFNAENVRILLSTDNGLTFPTVLVESTPNDGSQVITVPNLAAPYCRLIVEAVGNVFYAVNSKSFSIGYTIEDVVTCVNYTASPNAPIVGSAAPQWMELGSVTVPSGANISDLNLTVNITHPSMNDLYIGLRKPGSVTIDRILYQQGCPTGVANMNVTFDDAAAANIDCAGINGGNTYKPLYPLSTLNGANPGGVWKLMVADITTANSGTLNSFTLNICSTETVVSLKTETYNLSNFKIYPNPNSGNFNVQFDSQSSNDIKIAVHDLRGRQIFNKSYQNTGLFSQNLQLADAQSGIYLVTVQDGEKKEVKKIVIE